MDEVSLNEIRLSFRRNDKYIRKIIADNFIFIFIIDFSMANNYDRPSTIFAKDPFIRRFMSHRNRPTNEPNHPSHRAKDEMEKFELANGKDVFQGARVWS